MTAHDPALVERVEAVMSNVLGNYASDMKLSHREHAELGARAVLDAITTSHALVETCDSARKRCDCGNESDLSWCDDDCGRFTNWSRDDRP